ncbi:MAG: hypothetical protein FJ295_17055 [Planctomycetes bacterium]|nr:hypothetical protein [Planctomycetota bacterium]
MEVSTPFDNAAPESTSPQAEQASLAFVGRWRQLVSTTNWEKGRIIAHWRDALIEAGAAANEYSDDSWSRRVGGVTPQHVGRLRRVYQRFGTSYEKFPVLFWTHFQAAIDWNDAEMWLEGAVQNAWSVSEMRSMRWETMGSVEAQRPVASEIITVETDEDFDLTVEPASRRGDLDGATHPATNETADAEITGPGNFGSGHRSESDQATNDPLSTEETLTSASDPIPVVRPFADLPALPADLADAVEAFKLAIVRHKASEWSHVSPEDVLASLEALKCLVTAPSEAA